MKLNITDLSSAIQSAMQDYLDNGGRFNKHNPAIYVSDVEAETANVCYGSALETPGCFVIWDLQESLGSWTPEPGDDLISISAGAAEAMLPDMQRAVDDKLDEIAEQNSWAIDTETE